MRLQIAAVIMLSMMPLSVATSEVSLFRGQDGTSGTITDLGGGTGIYSDSHGTFGPIQDRGASQSTLTLPPGQSPQGTRTPFGTPPPPSNLTPAPVLPFQPHSPIMPGPGSAAPSVPFAPGVNPSGPSGSGSGFRGR
jgi:hypothetical protein